MATLISQSLVVTGGLSGTSWPMNTTSSASGEHQLMFLCGSIHAGTTTPSVSGWSSMVSATETTDMNVGIWVFHRTPGTSQSAGSPGQTVTWSGPGCQGFGWVCTMSDSQLDTQLAAVADITFPTSKTPAAITTAAGGARVDFIICRAHRIINTTGGTSVQRNEYSGNSAGGIGGAVRIQTGTSAGSTAGTTWTFIDADNAANPPDSQSINFTFALKTTAVGTTNPILSGESYMADATASLAPDTPTTPPTVTAIDSTSVNVTVSGWDTSADTIKIMRQEILGGTAQTAVEVKSIAVLGATFPQVVTGMVPGKTYRFFWYVVEGAMQSANNSPASANITMGVLFARLLVDSSAAGATGIDAQVWLNPPAGRIAGDFVAAATGLAFSSTLSGGQAVLTIPLGSYTGALSLGQTVVAVARRIAGPTQTWTRVAPATIAAT